MIIRYDELKVNDIIRFHGAKLRIVKLSETPAPANEYYPNEKKQFTSRLNPLTKTLKRLSVNFTHTVSTVALVALKHF